MKRELYSVIKFFLSALIVSGCAGHNFGSAFQQESLATTVPSFPEPSTATMRGGIYVNIANLRNIGIGLSKDQVRDLIGVPHFHEGVFAVHEWNYLLKFRRNGQTFSCRYQIRFDKEMKVDATYWQDPSCIDFIDSSRPVGSSTQTLAAAIKTSEKKMFLSNDALFAFGKSDINSISRGGRKEIEKVVEKVKDYKKIVSIDIVGHSDRIGSEESNQRLSTARAVAVRDYFVSEGIDSARMHINGVGSREPVSQCPHRRGQAIIACMNADRRVEISVRYLN